MYFHILNTVKTLYIYFLLHFTLLLLFAIELNFKQQQLKETYSHLRHNFTLMDVYTLHKYMLDLKLLTQLVRTISFTSTLCSKTVNVTFIVKLNCSHINAGLTTFSQCRQHKVVCVCFQLVDLHRRHFKNNTFLWKRHLQ